jgi:hypothetical protein
MVSGPVGGDPWADPATATEPGAPYSGPPPSAPGGPPPGYGYPGQWGPLPQWGAVPYGYPVPWGPMPPSRPGRPGQVITAGVLSFVQAGLVTFSSLYLWMLLSIAGFALREQPSRSGHALVTEGAVLAIVQAVSVPLLIAVGVLALNRRSRAAWLGLLGGHAAQLVLAVYWAIRLQTVVGDIPGATGAGALSAFTLLFAAAPLVAIGLVLFGSGRRWFDGTSRP